MNNKNTLLLKPSEKLNKDHLNLVSVIFLFDGPKKVLMQHRDNDSKIACPNIWGPVGGHCEVGETPYECCIRELFEETGYESSQLDWYGNFLVPYNCESNSKHVVSVFWALYDNIQVINCYEGQSINFLYLSLLKNYKMLDINSKWIKGIEKILLYAR